jgi:hypothetical protein
VAVAVSGASRSAALAWGDDSWAADFVTCAVFVVCMVGSSVAWVSVACVCVTVFFVVMA